MIMRIFCAIRHSRDPGQFYGGLWSANFYPALRQLGHEIVESQIDLLPTSRFMGIAKDFTPEELALRGQITEQILAEVRAAHQARPLDLFLSYFYNSHFDPAGFDELRRLGIPSINFYCNSMYQFAEVAGIATKVDFSWHTERDAAPSYRAAGARPVWVQMGADPQVYHPVSGIEPVLKASFVGQRYADRDRWMAALIEAEVPVDIFGSGWGVESDGIASNSSPSEEVYLGRRQSVPASAAAYLAAFCDTIEKEGLWRGAARMLRQWRYRNETRQLTPLLAAYAKGTVPFARMIEIMSSYQVCLNFSNVWTDGRPGSALIPHLRLRDFEAPMCRACYLTGHSDEIAQFYKIGTEIDTYQSEPELVDKARFYLAHPERAEKMREAGYRRALRDHTWVRRFEELFAKTGLSS